MSTDDQVTALAKRLGVPMPPSGTYAYHLAVADKLHALLGARFGDVALIAPDTLAARTAKWEHRKKPSLFALQLLADVATFLAVLGEQYDLPVLSDEASPATVPAISLLEVVRVKNEVNGFGNGLHSAIRVQLWLVEATYELFVMVDV